MKIVYIAHPIQSDPAGNVARILQIVKAINLTMPHVVPFAPYLADVQAMDETDPHQRHRGIHRN